MKGRTMPSLRHSALILSIVLVNLSIAHGYAPPIVSSRVGRKWSTGWTGTLRAAPEVDDEDEAARLRAKADELREQVREMEDKLGDRRSFRDYGGTEQPAVDEPEGMSLKNKRVLVTGANGRLGSMVCRHLLRNNPQTEVVAAVHYVGEASSRGYGRLSYEVGAEDGAGYIGPAWSSEDRTATFQYTDDMAEYNLRNLRVVDVELLDPVQCMTVTEDVDCVVWCATDFNGNQPRAISGLNVAFLFRAVADPTKGRVEIEGLRNILGGLKVGRPDGSGGGRNDPISFVHVSAAEEAYVDFETPFGTFNGLKREGETIVEDEFPSLSHCILKMSRYEDNFVDEGLDISRDDGSNAEELDEVARSRRRINRRDAARAVSEALTDESLLGKTVELFTATRGATR